MSVRARVRKRSPSTSVVRSTRSHSAGGWKSPRKRRATRSKRRGRRPRRPPGEGPGRDDREVVGDLGVVEGARLVLEAASSRRCAARRTPRRVDIRDSSALRPASAKVRSTCHRLAVVVGQAARIGSRVGEELVCFVAALRRGERAPRRPAEAAVASRCRLVRSKSGGAGLPRRLARLVGAARASRRSRDDRAGARLVEDAVVPDVVGVCSRRRTGRTRCPV